MTTQELVAHPVTSVILFILMFVFVYFIVGMADAESKERKKVRH
jgi:hypothetical protein